MFKNKVIILLIISLFMVFPVKAKFVGMFADIDAARPSGMAGAFVAVSDDVNALIWNNAGLAYAQREVIFMKSSPYNVDYNFIACSMPYVDKKNTGIGIGLITFGDPLLRETTLLMGGGLETSEILNKLLFKKIPINFLISNGFTFKLRFISVGQNLEKHPDKSTGGGFGFGADFGLLIKFNKNLNLGLNLKDLCSVMFCHSNISGSYSEFIPISNNIGLKYMVTKKALVSIELDNFRWMKLGTELNFNKFFVLRGGLILLSQGQNFRQMYSIGTGLKLPLKSTCSQLDLSYNFDPVLPNIFKISLNLIF